MQPKKRYKRCGCERRLGHRTKEQRAEKELGRLLAVAAVPARLRLLLLLAQRPHCVCDLMAHTGLSQTLVSHHLADIMQAKLASRKRALGGFIDYSLTQKGRTFVACLHALVH